MNRIFLQKKFFYYLKRSIYLHLAIIGGLLISGKFIFDREKSLVEKNIQLVSSSVRVDLVAMPEYTLNELKNIAAAEESAKHLAKSKAEEAEKLEAKNQEKRDLEKSQEKHESFLTKLKKIGSKNKDHPKEDSSDLKKLVIAGNKLSKGISIYGEGSNKNTTDFLMYAEKLPDIVRPNWRLPSFLMGKKLKCRIRVWIAMNGEVTNVEVYQSSGDREYDQRAIEAVKASSPFPKLSKEFAQRGLDGDIALGFPL